ncbi:MAG: DUF222 domain-containing protein, partial [Sporichthyaceae bacterium]|nr:DUF222 domain-containing protein [Sporichthyaceae bacterium]
MRRSADRVAAEQARQLRLVAELADRCEAAALAELARGPRVPGQPLPEAVADSAMTGEVMAVLGIGEGPAQRLVGLSRRLTHVLPDALGALAAGRVDLSRVRTLAEAMELVADDTARRVARELLVGAGDRPWSGPSPRAWRGRV